MTPSPLPTFLIVGAQKSATRWLRHNLAQHPDVFAAHDELHFFDHRHPTAEAVDEYRSHFDNWAGEQHVGEATPGYMFWRNNPACVAHRIASVVPNAHILVILRNPVDRALSAFSHHMRRHRIDPDQDILEWVLRKPPEHDHLGIISGGWYAASLEPYLEHFGDQVKVVLNDDIKADAALTYRSILSHLALSPFLPDGLYARHHSIGPPEGSSIDDGTGRLRSLSKKERTLLHEYFADDIRALELLLGRRLGQWRLT